jgi:hypothetical protein
MWGGYSLVRIAIRIGKGSGRPSLQGEIRKEFLALASWCANLGRFHDLGWHALGTP